MTKKIRSIIPGDSKYKCFFCNRYFNDYFKGEAHHIFGGANRPLSDEDGLVIHLCYECHRGEKGIHGRDGLPIKVKAQRIGQQEWEDNRMKLFDLTREEATKQFILRYGKSYQ